MALLPFVPNVSIAPEFILPLLLPPLLYAAAQRSSWREFAANARPITLLAVALVLVTTAAVVVVADRDDPRAAARGRSRAGRAGGAAGTRWRPPRWPGVCGCRGGWWRSWR